MTRKETKDRLSVVKLELSKLPDHIIFGQPDFFKMWRLLWEEKALKVSLETGIDLDTVIHPNEAKKGKGLPFND